MTPLQTYEAKREPQFGKKKSFCLIKNGDILQLDRKHHYHHQVQGQHRKKNQKSIDVI